MFFSYFLVPIGFLVLTERMIDLYSPTSAATDMDVDKTPADEEADDVVTSKASKFARLEVCLVDWNIDQLSLWLSLFIAAPQDIVVLPDDEEVVPLRGRRRKDKEPSRKATEAQVLRSTGTLAATVERSTDPARTKRHLCCSSVD